MSKREPKQWVWVDLLTLGSPPQIAAVVSIALLMAALYLFLTLGKTGHL